jgi:hypothetical protein
MKHLIAYQRLASMALVPAAILLLSAGCSSIPKSQCQTATAAQDCVCPQQPTIVRGKPAPVLDTVGWIVGIPSKILMLDHRVNNHNVSEKTEEAVAEYLAINGLDDVAVRVNQYDPVGEWHRLGQNSSVAWPVRYTLGTLSVACYTVLPGRVFGGDRYNPFTNTINLYSDVPAVALYEGGRACDYSCRDHKTLYTVVGIVPGVNVLQEVRASGNAMDYLRANGTDDDLNAGYRSISPMFAINAGQSLSAFTSFPLVLPAAAVGHVSGYVQSRMDHTRDREPASPEEDRVSLVSFND